MSELRTRLEGIYFKMRRRMVPKLQGPQDIYENVLQKLVGSDLTWLDVGCGHQLLPEWREDGERRLIAESGTIVGIDYDLPSLQAHRSISLLVRGNIAQLPFSDESFDLATANMVVEHLDDPLAQFKEISRVLKPGGIFLFHTPNAHGYFSLIRRLVPERLAYNLVAILDGRDKADVFPVHYKANTTKRINSLARAAGMEVKKTKMVVSDAVSQVIIPLAFFELICIRVLMTEPLKPFRTNIIALLKKPAASV